MPVFGEAHLRISQNADLMVIWQRMTQFRVGQLPPMVARLAGPLRVRLVAVSSLNVTSRMFSGGPDRGELGVSSVLAGQRLINIGWSHHRYCARRPVPRRPASEQQRQRA